MNYIDKRKKLFDLIDNNKFRKNSKIMISEYDEKNIKTYRVSYNCLFAVTCLRENLSDSFDYGFYCDNINYGLSNVIELIKTETLSYWRENRLNKIYE